MAKRAYLSYPLLSHDWLQTMPHLFCGAVYTPNVASLNTIEWYYTSNIIVSSIFWLSGSSKVSVVKIVDSNWSVAQIHMSKFTKVEPSTKQLHGLILQPQAKYAIAAFSAAVKLIQYKISPFMNTGLTEPLDFDLFEMRKSLFGPLNTNIGLSSTSCRNLFNSMRGKV